MRLEHGIFVWLLRSYVRVGHLLNVDMVTIAGLDAQIMVEISCLLPLFGGSLPSNPR